MKKILIFGSSGFVGSYLHKTLDNLGYLVVGTGFENATSDIKKVNLLNVSETRKILSDVAPDLVIFLSGIKDIKRCESNPEIAIDTNVTAVRNYIDSCYKNKQRPLTLFFSTDCVFDGIKGYYKVEDTTNPKTVYGATNMLAEQLLLSSGLPGKILRVSAIMGRSGGFFQWINGKILESTPVDLYSNSYFSPTSIGRVCEFVREYANKNLTQKNLEEDMTISHLSDGYRMSRYEFGCILANKIGVNSNLMSSVKFEIGDSFYQQDLSLLPDGMNDFLSSYNWNEMENIF